MTWATLKRGGAVAVSLACASAWPAPQAWGVYLDKDETIKFGARMYVNARIGTEKTDKTLFTGLYPEQPTPGQTQAVVSVLDARTFPESPAGHLRQNRFFLEADFEHDIRRLLSQGVGPLALLRDLPFKIDELKYKLTYRGEGEGIYDWGPREYRARDAYVELLGAADGTINPPLTCTLQACPDIAAARRELHRQASNRHRLYQVYADVVIGDLFIRAGRQVLVWGETDNFRLLDNINPVDSSFGGFLIDLDERRQPLDMIRASYNLGGSGETITEALIEGYAAVDNKVSFYPGVLAGSPWAPPNLGSPDGIPPGSTKNFVLRPGRSLSNIRGGARLLFNAFDVTWSVAHYYTFADNPAVQTCVGPFFPAQKVSTRLGGSGPIPGCPVPVQNAPIAQRAACRSPGADGRYGTGDDEPPGCRPPGMYDILGPNAYSVQMPARMQVSGASATFTVPARLSRRLGLSGEPVIRAEVAYFKDEPSASQRRLDPFTYLLSSADPVQTVAPEKLDSINVVLGIDTNQFFRQLNKVNSFFISTQFFYKHVMHAPEDLALPVPAAYAQFEKTPGLGAIQPIFVRSAPDQFLQTLFVGTSYRGGVINPSLTLFYDWSGAVTYIPAVTLHREPFRFAIEYDLLDAGTLKGNSGVSLLRDRDSIVFRLEYVI